MDESKSQLANNPFRLKKFIILLVITPQVKSSHKLNQCPILLGHFTIVQKEARIRLERKTVSIKSD